jgi:hypothetical protein
VIPVSEPTNPDPVTVTELPGAPLLRLREMPGPTVKYATGTIAACVMEP